MKKFVKDYVNLYKESFRFMREHWVGCIVWNAVIAFAMFAYYGIYWGIWVFDWMETNWNKITNLFRKA